MEETVFDVAVRDEDGIEHHVTSEPLTAFEAYDLMEQQGLNEGWSWIMTPSGTTEFDPSAKLEEIIADSKRSDLRIQAWCDQKDAAARDGNL